MGASPGLLKVDKETLGIRGKLLSEWSRTKTNLQQLNSTFNYRPRDDEAIVRQGDRSSAESVSLDVGPLAFNVPERGDSSIGRLFIYLDGSLEFSRKTWIDSGRLEITSTTAEAAYFAVRKGELVLVYGGHYDYALGQQGHPAFHHQLRNNLFEGGEFIKQQFNLSYQIKDGLEGVLRNVRVPSAQMDAFSCMLKIAADHLLPQGPSPHQRDAFNALRGSSTLCGISCNAQSPPSLLPHVLPYSCYRARHWYGRI
jgi:hypothetical protein